VTGVPAAIPEPSCEQLNNLAGAVELRGRLAEAEAMFDRALSIGRARLGAEHPQVVQYSLNLARVEIARGRGSAAEPALRHVLEIRGRLLDPSDWRIGQAKSLLGASLLTQRRYADAEPLMLDANRILAAVPGPQGRERASNRRRLVALSEKLGRRRQADAVR
jgi:hypothetical protein